MRKSFLQIRRFMNRLFLESGICVLIALAIFLACMDIYFGQGLISSNGFASARTFAIELGLLLGLLRTLKPMGYGGTILISLSGTVLLLVVIALQGYLQHHFLLATANSISFSLTFNLISALLTGIGISFTSQKLKTNLPPKWKVFFGQEAHA